MATPTKAQLENQRRVITKALESAAEELGLDSISMGTIRFDETGFKSSIDVKFKLDEEAKQRLVEDLQLTLKMAGVDPKLATEPFVIGGKSFTVKEVKRTRILVHCSDDDKDYTVSIADVARKYPHSE